MTGIIDTHLHLWDLSVGEYAWLGPEHGALHRTYTAEDAVRTLRAAGVERAVVVQAEDSVNDTDFLLGAARDHSELAGVVGWLRLDDPVTTAAQLADYGAHLCGVRHLVHDDPRADFLELPAVRASLRLVADAGLPLDVPDAWPRHLYQVETLGRDLPELRLVVDHLAKPPRHRPEDMRSWARSLRSTAQLPHVFAKVSGLQAPGEPFTVEALRPVVDVALECFGPDRLMWGSDWPMTANEGTYAEHWQVMDSMLSELSSSERDMLVCGTAESVYRLDDSRARDAPTAGSEGD
jgi:L-fuconolactonase